MVAVALSVCTSHAAIMSDPNAMSGWTGSKLFVSSPEARLYVTVEYAVYAPGQFGLSYSGQDPSNDSQYVYAYEIFNNDPNHPRQDLPDYVRRLSVGLDGDEQPANATWVDLTPDLPLHQDPSNASFVSSGGIITSVGWNYASDNRLIYDYPNTGGRASDVLFFTSPFGPEWDSATVSGNLFDSDTLPSPLPEPATLALLGLGAAVMLRRWKRIH